MSETSQMPVLKSYIGTKIIFACPQEKEGKPGYKVVYSDSYESWSPKDVFEKAYKPCLAMNFGLALEALKMGKKIRQDGWEQSAYLKFRFPDPNIPGDKGDILICGKQANGVMAETSWICPTENILAQDWQIVEEPQEAA